MKSFKGLFFGLSILVLLLALVACSDDDSTEPQVTEDPPPPSPQLLVEDFIDVLEGEDLAGLDWLLNEDFRMIISAETLDDWAGGGHPLLVDYFDHEGFLEIHANIFNDSTGIDPAGNPVSPITGISVDLMEKVGSWTQIDPEMEYFGDFEGTYSCRWNVLIHFNLQGNSRFELNHQVDLLARPVTVGEDSGWELVGIVPLVYSAANKTESIGWDDVLALYR